MLRFGREVLLRKLYLVGFWAVVPLLAARAASACGGGGVTTTSSGVVADSQRVVLALHGEGTADVTTEVVAQIGVPKSAADYGVLIPVPTEPTLDPEPVPVGELDAFDAHTAPVIVKETYTGGSSESGGCGCISAGDDDSAPGGGDQNTATVSVGAPVAIGPVTAVVIGADDATALAAWLDDNGFAIPEAEQPILDTYVAAGDRFIAIKRTDATPSSAPSSIGIHYTLEGDHRVLSLGFARIGAAPQVAFTVFVASKDSVEPAPPFSTRTISDLDAGALAKSYSNAVAKAVADNHSQAFVIENITGPPIAGAGDRLRAIFGIENHVTRLSTIIAADKLDADASFDAPGPPSVTHTRHLAARRTRIEGASVGLLAVTLVARSLRRRLRKGNLT
jgi:hypothetical protein